MVGQTDIVRIDPAYRSALEQADLASVPAVLRRRNGLVVAWSRTTDTVELRLNGGRLAVFVKRYHYPHWANRIKPMLRGTFFGRSRACSEFAALQAMRRLGIPAARPIAYGERRIWHFVRSCFLITETVPAAMPLARFIRDHLDGDASAAAMRARREVVVSLADHVRRMHKTGFAHGDLFLRNVLVRATPGERFEFFFLDAALGRRRGRRRVTARPFVRDVASMFTAVAGRCRRTELVRFTKRYLGVKTIDEPTRRWLRQVSEEAAALQSKESRRLQLDELFDMHRHVVGR